MRIALKRVYETPTDEDGLRILVDRLWPRGMTRDQADIDLWLKDAAPSTALREWFGHEPGRWDAFKTRYFAELDARGDSLTPLFNAIHAGKVTLVYASRDTAHNQAVALRDYLLSKELNQEDGYTPSNPNSLDNS